MSKALPGYNRPSNHTRSPPNPATLPVTYHLPRTVWLASSPKSGNTWLRVFLANLLHPELAPVALNRLPLSTPIGSSRVQFDDLLGIPSALLTPGEIESLRPAADRELNRTWQEPLLCRKAHDAYSRLPDGRPLLGECPDFAAIYLLRDPWDVAVSMTNHFDCTLEQAVDNLCNPAFAVARGGQQLYNQLAQRLLSWEEHARSWLGAPLALHLLRYESMRYDPLPSFRGVVRFLGLAHDDVAIAAALEACRFERLQQQEQQQRFRETPKHTRRFFRAGRVGEGLERLSDAALQRLTAMKANVEQAIADRGPPG